MSTLFSQFLSVRTSRRPVASRQKEFSSRLLLPVLISGWLALWTEATFAQTIPVEWVRQIGSTLQDNISSRMAIDSSGNCIVAGTYSEGTSSSRASADFGTTNLPSIGGTDIYIAKYDSSGNLLWARSAGGTNQDTLGGMALGSNGKVFVTGSIRRTAYFGTNTVTAANNGIDMFIASYDANGTLNWVRNYGGGSVESPQSIAVDSAGALYVAGSFSGATTSIGGIILSNIYQASGASADIFVAKFDALGNVIWATRAGGADEWDNGYDSASAVGVDGAGYVYLAGHFASFRGIFGPYTFTNNTASMTYLAKYDNAGNVVWARKLITNPLRPADEQSSVSDMVVDSAGNAHVCGQYNNNVFIDGFALTNANSSRDNGFVAKIAANGNALWALGGGGTDSDVVRSVALDVAGNSYVAGSYWGPWSFGQRTLPAIGSSFALCVFKIDIDGNVQWAYGAGSEADAHGRAIAADPNGNTYVGGTFSWNVAFGGTNLTDHTFAGDVFLFKGPRPPSRITSQPQSQTAAVGDTVTFSVVADGEPPLSYQWLFNGTNIVGATGSVLTLTNTMHAQAGFYSVIVSNQAGTVTSAVVQLLFNFLTLKMYAGLTIDGESGQSFQVQYVPALGNQTNWQTLTNVTLTNVPYLFIDVESPKLPQRFYRALPFP